MVVLCGGKPGMCVDGWVAGGQVGGGRAGGGLCGGRGRTEVSEENGIPRRLDNVWVVW